MATVSSPAAPTAIEDFAFHRVAPLSPPHSKPYTYKEEHLDLSCEPVEHLPSEHYSGTAHTYVESSGSAQSDGHNDYDEEEEMARLDGTATTSSRSSISSLPASVSASAIIPPPDAITPTKSPPFQSRIHNLSHGVKSPSRSGERDRESPFRHPSSVRAMQMGEEEELLTPHPRAGLRPERTSGLPLSVRSSISPTSPTKRSSRGMRSSPQKPKMKKEHPLVLLHCSLLPPSLPLQLNPGIASHRDLLQEVLPDEYWRRWKLLVDKIDGEVKERGILIRHPGEDYETLEERLLESLELAPARIRSGHFIGNTDTGNVDLNGDEDGEEAVDVAEGQKCPDCGKKVIKDLDIDRKWEVKVYAANGLMRTGAWGAAWSEMERVDVEIGVWLPETIRRDAEIRLQESGVVEMMRELHETEEEKRTREIYGEENERLQEQVDGLDDADGHHHESFHAESHDYAHRTPLEADLQTLMVNYLRLLATDRRNIAIALLSCLVIFFSMASSQARVSAPSVAVQSVPTPVATVADYAPISTSTLQETVLQTPVAVEAEVVDAHQVDAMSEEVVAERMEM